MPIAVSLNHAPSVVTWALRVATHPELGPWLLDDVHRFAAFYATLNGRLKWPERLTTALKGEAGDGEVRIKLEEQSYQEWRKNPDHPFNGRLSPRFLEAFWQGTVVYRFTQHHASEWKDILATVQRTWESQRLVSDEERKTDVERLADALNRSGVIDEDAGIAPLDGGVEDRTVRTPRTNDVVTMFALNGLFINRLLALTPDEVHLMEMAFLLREDEGFRMWWDLLASDAHDARAVLQAMLDLDEDRLDAISDPAGRLASSQLLTFTKDERKVMPMSAFWHGWFIEPTVSEGDLFGKLMMPVRKHANAGALGRVGPDDREMLEGLLRHPVHHETGLNLLLYGAKSIDKQGFVVDLLRQMNLKGYTLAPRIPDEDLPSACFVVQRYLARIDPEGVLVLPKADGVLPRTQRGMRQLMFFTVEIDDEAIDSPTERHLLLDNPIKTVWLVNAPERLSEENLGRFLYTCEVKGASRAERRLEVETVLGGMGLSPEFFADLSQHTRLSEQQLRSAARLAELLSEPALPEESPESQALATALLDPATLAAYNQLRRDQAQEQAPASLAIQAQKEHLVRRAIEQSQKALDRREREDLRQPITQYSLDLLNVAGGFSVHQIMASLKKRPKASLCFWGLPGTGKTQLAEHIAVEIDKPILIKRASDILDKYLGESEKRIREMFMEARDEDAVLLLDEADTFLRDRSMARYNHEIAMVNELLQGMERFHGVFICTTNLFQHLDMASMRRFTFKLQFMALNPEQRWRMFVTEAELDASTLSETDVAHWKEELMFMQYLAPGDFATIKNQCRLLDVQLSPNQWIEQLKQEMEAKSHQMRTPA